MMETKDSDGEFSRRRMIPGIRKRLGETNWEVIGRRLLGVICGVVFLGMLAAGLWPFHSPKNQVAWLAAGNGLRFGRRGTILSSTGFKASELPPDTACSLEIWFETAHPWNRATLVSFYSPRSSRQFSLRKFNGDLVVQIDTPGTPYRTRTTSLDIEDVLVRPRASFVTITSKGGQTSVYVDGGLARTAAGFALSGRDFDGELIVANSPKAANGWSGLLRGLALYDEALSPAQVLHHYETWTTFGRPDLAEIDRAVAVYLFDEHTGRLVHNRVRSGTDLYIPERYLVVDQAFLRPFWEEYEPSRDYWEGDVLYNVVGFIPFGFLLSAYFSLAGRVKRPALVAIAAGFAFSLTIECLQALLPTRDSGTTDIITNTLGTGLGAWLYRWNFWRDPWRRIWTHLVGW